MYIGVIFTDGTRKAFRADSRFRAEVGAQFASVTFRKTRMRGPSCFAVLVDRKVIAALVRAK